MKTSSGLRRFVTDILDCFRGMNLIWQLVAIGLTAIFVLSGFDWWYFMQTRSPILFAILIPSAIVGMLVPVLVPIILLIVGRIWKNKETVRTAWALAQAESIALLISFFYKAFTGRVPPVLANSMIDISRDFRFGFLRGGVFWGWPSSHTIVAFAFAVTLCTLYPRNKLIRWLSLAYAFYIGIGVSTTIHWFSEFVAGAIFGAVVGRVVGRSFLKRRKI